MGQTDRQNLVERNGLAVGSGSPSVVVECVPRVRHAKLRSPLFRSEQLRRQPRVLPIALAAPLLALCDHVDESGVAGGPHAVPEDDALVCAALKEGVKPFVKLPHREEIHSGIPCRLPRPHVPAAVVRVRACYLARHVEIDAVQPEVVHDPLDRVQHEVAIGASAARVLRLASERCPTPARQTLPLASIEPKLRRLHCGGREVEVRPQLRSVRFRSGHAVFGNAGVVKLGVRQATQEMVGRAEENTSHQARRHLRGKVACVPSLGIFGPGSDRCGLPGIVVGKRPRHTHGLTDQVDDHSRHAVLMAHLDSPRAE